MKIGIIGYGKMGRGIFCLLSEAREDVIVFVRDPLKAAKYGQRFEKRLRRAVRHGTLGEAELDKRQKKLQFSYDLNDLRDCGLIIESIVEDFESKAEVLRRVETLVAPDTIITTNSSSLSVTDLGATLRRPERFCGLHFFHPLQLTTTVEIIRSDRTSAATVGALQGICGELLQKRPLVVRDLPGSCVNAPLSFLVCEALYILEQGLAPPSRIDAIANSMMRAAPCATADIVGLPLINAVMENSLCSILGSFSRPDLVRKLMSDGRHGKAVNRGIYLYREDRPLDDDPAYYRNPGQTHSRNGRGDDDAILQRLSAPLYYSLLRMAQLKLGSLEDLCAGTADAIGLKIDPLETMKDLGTTGMSDLFSRLSRELGPRYDCRPIEDILSSLDELGAAVP